MKIFKDRRLNKWYQSLNVKKVSDLKDGDEIILTTEGREYFNGNGIFAINQFADKLVSNVLEKPFIAVLKEKPNFDGSDWKEVIHSTGNYLFQSLNSIHLIETAAILGAKDRLRYVSVKLDERIITNIKSRYADDDVITFEVVSLGKEVYDSNSDYCKGVPSFFHIEEVVSFYTEKVDIATEEKILELYRLVASKLLERYHLLKCLRQGYKVIDKDDFPFVVKEDDFETLDDLIMLGDKIINEYNRVEDYANSYRVIEEYFKGRDTVVKSVFFGALDIYNDDNELACLLPAIFS